MPAFTKRYRKLPSRIKTDVQNAMQELATNQASALKHLSVEAYGVTKSARKFRVKKCKPHKDYRLAYYVRKKPRALVLLYVDNRGRFYGYLSGNQLNSLLKPKK